MKRLIYLSYILLLAACGDFGNGILEQKPETGVASTNFWQTEEDLSASTRELSVQFRRCFGDVTRRVYRDRGTLFDYKGALWANISLNKLDMTWNLKDPAISWVMEYNVISQANQILANIGNVKVSQERKDTGRGQALTLRAFTYLYIIQMWGDAPLLLDAFDNGPRARTPWETIAGIIIKDLEEAITLLPATSANKQLPTKGTANAVLAQVCAWKGSITNDASLLNKGIDAATAVIGGGEFELIDDLRAIIRGGSNESILELVYYSNIESEMNPLGSCMAFACEAYPVMPNNLPQTKRRNFRLSNAKAKAVFNTCGRWFDTVFYHFDEMASEPETTTQGAAYICKFPDIIKYEDGPQVGLARAFAQNEILIRLADIILLRAEMYARIGNTSGAIADLNTVRSRCGAEAYSAVEGDLLKAVFHQREQELFLEGINIRFIDIVRNGVAYIHEYLDGDYKNVKSIEDTFLPVHTDAFFNNPQMRQTGYWQNSAAFKI